MEPISVIVVLGTAVGGGLLAKFVNWIRRNRNETEEEPAERLERQRADRQHQNQLLRVENDHQQKMAVILEDREIINREIEERTENIKRLEKAIGER